VNAGISITLLSVCLATLMALLRDPEVPILLSQEDLRVLIVESGTALLDSRLAGHTDLDEATSTQMVRAINKVWRSLYDVDPNSGDQRSHDLEFLCALNSLPYKPPLGLLELLRSSLC
jgi:hypothetical protein